MAAKKKYDKEYKVQAVKLGREIGFVKAAKELDVNVDTLYPQMRGAILHSDRGSQYTSQLYREELGRQSITQSMNSAGGRCHDNARCEAMWARMKEELLYGRYDSKRMTMEELKTLIWRCFMSYWNNRRICSANGGLPPMVKRQRKNSILNPFLLLWSPIYAKPRFSPDGNRGCLTD